MWPIVCSPNALLFVRYFFELNILARTIISTTTTTIKPSCQKPTFKKFIAIIFSRSWIRNFIMYRLNTLKYLFAQLHLYTPYIFLELIHSGGTNYIGR